jgi:hypothetical protein
MKKITLALFLLSLSIGSFATKIELVSGSLSKIAGVKEFNIEYDFSNFAVAENGTRIHRC